MARRTTSNIPPQESNPAPESKGKGHFDPTPSETTESLQSASEAMSKLTDALDAQYKTENHKNTEPVDTAGLDTVLESLKQGAVYDTVAAKRLKAATDLAVAGQQADRVIQRIDAERKAEQAKDLHNVGTVIATTMDAVLRPIATLDRFATKGLTVAGSALLGVSRSVSNMFSSQAPDNAATVKGQDREVTQPANLLGTLSSDVAPKDVQPIEGGLLATPSTALQPKASPEDVRDRNTFFTNPAQSKLGRFLSRLFGKTEDISKKPEADKGMSLLDMLAMAAMGLLNPLGLLKTAFGTLKDWVTNLFKPGAPSVPGAAPVTLGQRLTGAFGGAAGHSTAVVAGSALVGLAAVAGAAYVGSKRYGKAKSKFTGEEEYEDTDELGNKVVKTRKVDKDIMGGLSDVVLGEKYNKDMAGLDVAKQDASQAVMGAGAGAAIGAIAGSFIPGVGTAVGAAIGAGVGAATAFVGNEVKKAVDTNVGPRMQQGWEEGGLRGALDAFADSPMWLSKAMGAGLEGFDKTADWFGRQWGTAQEKLQPFMKGVSERTQKLTESAKKNVTTLSKTALAMFDGFADGLRDTTGIDVKAASKSMLGGVQGFLDKVSTEFEKFKKDPAGTVKEWTTSIIESIKSFFNGIFQGMQDFFANPLKFVTDFVESKKQDPKSPIGVAVRTAEAVFDTATDAWDNAKSALGLSEPKPKLAAATAGASDTTGGTANNDRNLTVQTVIADKPAVR